MLWTPNSGKDFQLSQIEDSRSGSVIMQTLGNVIIKMVATEVNYKSLLF